MHSVMEDEDTCSAFLSTDFWRRENPRDYHAEVNKMLDKGIKDDKLRSVASAEEKALREAVELDDENPVEGGVVTKEKEKERAKTMAKTMAKATTRSPQTAQSD